MQEQWPENFRSSGRFVKTEAERVGRHMIRPVLSFDRLAFLEHEGKVGCRHGQDSVEQETMDYLEFTVRVVLRIPDNGQVTVRYYGLYANAHQSKMRKARAEVFDRARSILTSPEGGFILVREAGMEFRGEGESGPETARKNKFLFLKNAKEFAFAVRCIKD